ncbi:unnamed protein product [Paramecium sonneborni]|uniref:Uncharacterized protein n=1 Tax=Paramecium sonneborni TaxID=65129 RepID=A0A8S1MFE1_9CILI|nr:unnamed protein product [Paramecium sonneborni]
MQQSSIKKLQWKKILIINQLNDSPKNRLILLIQINSIDLVSLNPIDFKLALRKAQT